ncbi:DUF177 domain-containing protein [Parvularcula sp. LCG005]|uniref:YceD family protein n=1 Tax=Parvularcula sp. LCG005 TaxID=3078805 RepID=UPI00294241F3|nr:DUF177 domain-containing protein [Parvularcula sp. LCG005]WOI54232.1 DUF177 domain-containing protein [Parvularcula sp. LCG005]
MSEPTEMPSFSRSLKADDLGAEPYSVELHAAEADLAGIAQYLMIPGVDAMRGEADVTRRGDLITVSGRVEATLVRECVATLEPMEELIDEDFVATFTTSAPDADDLRDEVEADLDAPEPLENDRLDMGAVFLEHVVLSMAPHPRRQNAEPIPDPGAGVRISAFDALKALKTGDDD